MSAAEVSNVDPELKMKMSIQQAFTQPNAGPEVLAPGMTEVEPPISPRFTQDSIDPAFRLPVADDHSPAQPPPQRHASVESSSVTEGQQTAEKAKKKNAQGPRLKKACDSCSKRKIKCDESGPPCKHCSEVGIPCTFTRQSRRRGPRNRHADAIKEELAMAGGSYPRSGLASPTYAAQTLASLAQQPVMSADSICPPPLLERFVDDYFTFIHPLVPVPHEPSFRAALAAREDMNNPIFLALLASMIGYLVAAFPRRPKLHVHHLRMEGIFQNSDVLLDRCRRTAVEARGIGYLDRQQTMHDAIIAYFQGMIGAYHYNWDACRLYLGQCITISRVIGLYKQDGPGCAPAVNANGGEETVPQPGGDIVVRETSRRLFWTLYSTITSLQHLGLSARDLSIAHPTKPEPYPDLPVEVDDMYITPQGVRPMPQGRTSRLVGFNAIVKVYQACAEVSTMEMAYGLSEIFDSVAKGVIITRALDAARLALKNLPPELTYGSESSSTAQAQQEQSKYPPPTQGYPELHSGQMAMHIDNSNTERKEIQFEIQKLNIVATGIATRCILLEKYSQVSDNAQSSTETGRDPEDVMREERDEMTKDFLRMIRDLDLTYLEPAGLGFTNKLRQVASILNNTPKHRKSELHRRVEWYVLRLVDYIHHIQRAGPGAAEGVNEEELRARQWAEMLQSMDEYI